MTGKRILLVEDDPNLGFVIKDNLAIKGYDVTLCTDGEEAGRTFRSAQFHLCIFDVMLPKKDGFTLAREVRSVNKQIPIIFLTAKAMVDDKLEGFQTGADDYITKPFSLEELYYRIEVFLRRSSESPAAPETTFTIGEFSFDYSRLLIQRNGTQKSLTQKEAEVLRFLCINRERVLKREEILNHIWGDDDYFMGRSLDVFISKLRKYLREDPSISIANYHGVGFRLEVEGWPTEKV